MQLHFQCEGTCLKYLGMVTFEFQGHGVNLKVTVAKQRQHAGLCSPRTQFNKICDFTSGVLSMNMNMNTAVAYCRRAMSESCEKLCQFILDLIRCRDWYGSNDECILDRNEIC